MILLVLMKWELFATDADTMIDNVSEVDLNIIKALGLVVSDKKIFKVFILKIYFGLSVLDMQKTGTI